MKKNSIKTYPIDEKLLITLVELRPILWDDKERYYNNTSMRLVAWREVCCAMNDDYEHKTNWRFKQKYEKAIVTKWNQLRDKWIENYSMVPSNKRYKYKKRMWFLKRTVDPDEGDHYVSDESGNEEDEPNIHESEDIEFVIPIRKEIPTKQYQKKDVVRYKKKDKPKQDPDPINPTIPSVDCQTETQNNTQIEDRNMLFFKSLLPSLALLNDDQTLQFQTGVLSSTNFADYQQNNAHTEDRNISFFKSLLPSLALLDDDQTLQFQADVISLLQDIKKGNYNESPDQQSDIFGHSNVKDENVDEQNNVKIEIFDDF